EGVDVVVVLEGPADLDATVALRVQRADQLVDEERTDPLPAPVRADSERHEPSLPDPREREEEPDDAERKEAPPEMLEGDVDVRDDEPEADRRAVHLDEADQLGHDRGLQLFRHVVDLGVGHGDEAPVLLPGLVVDALHARELLGEALHLERTRGEAANLPGARNDPEEHGWALLGDWGAEGVE